MGSGPPHHYLGSANLFGAVFSVVSPLLPAFAMSDSEANLLSDGPGDVSDWSSDAGSDPEESIADLW